MINNSKNRERKKKLELERWLHKNAISIMRHSWFYSAHQKSGMCSYQTALIFKSFFFFFAGRLLRSGHGQLVSRGSTWSHQKYPAGTDGVHPPRTGTLCTMLSQQSIQKGNFGHVQRGRPVTIVMLPCQLMNSWVEFLQQCHSGTLMKDHPKYRLKVVLKVG